MLLADPDHASPVLSMYWHRVFPGTADQARTVRAFAAALLEGCPALHDVQLVLDELVVNALRHTRSGRAGGRFTVAVLRRPDEVSVGVTDEGGSRTPLAGVPVVPDDLSELAESGRGLLTVAALSTRWSWSGDARGRTVHASFDVPGA